MSHNNTPNQNRMRIICFPVPGTHIGIGYQSWFNARIEGNDQLRGSGGTMQEALGDLIQKAQQQLNIEVVKGPMEGKIPERQGRASCISPRGKIMGGIL